MKRHTELALAGLGAPILTLLAAAVLMCRIPRLEGAEEPPFGIDHRIPWTTSRVVGSPEPPLPFTVEKTFTNISWRAPIFVTPEPGTERLLVVQAGGEKERPSRVLSVPHDARASRVEPFLVVSNRLIYSVTFHPGYRTNGYFFVFSNGPTPQGERTNRISRFTVKPQTPRRRCRECRR